MHTQQSLVTTRHARILKVIFMAVLLLAMCQPLLAHGEQDATIAQDEASTVPLDEITLTEATSAQTEDVSVGALPNQTITAEDDQTGTPSADSNDSIPVNTSEETSDVSEDEETSEAPIVMLATASDTASQSTPSTPGNLEIYIDCDDGSIQTSRLAVYIYDEEGNEATQTFFARGYTNSGMDSYWSSYIRSGDDLPICSSRIPGRISNIPAGYSYRIVPHYRDTFDYEQEILGYTNIEGTIESGTTSIARLNVGNSRPPSLQVTTSSSSKGYRDAEFTYKITLIDAEGNLLTSPVSYQVHDTVNNTGAIIDRGTITGTGRVSVKAGTTINFTALPVNTTYEVSLIEMEDGYSLRSGTTERTKNVGIAWTSYESFYVTSGADTGSIMVRNYVAPGSNSSQKFSYTLVVRDGEGNIDTSEHAYRLTPLGTGSTYSNGPATGYFFSGDTIEVAASEALIVRDLLSGDRVYITESLPDGWTAEVSGVATDPVLSSDSLSFSKVPQSFYDSSNRADVINRETSEEASAVGNLVIKKETDGGDPDQIFAINLCFRNTDGTLITQPLVIKNLATGTENTYQADSYGYYTIRTKAGQEWLVENYTAGFSYLVIERRQDAVKNYALISSENCSGVITANETQHATLLNHYEEGLVMGSIGLETMADGGPAYAHLSRYGSAWVPASYKITLVDNDGNTWPYPISYYRANTQFGSNAKMQAGTIMSGDIIEPDPSWRGASSSSSGLTILAPVGWKLTAELVDYEDYGFPGALSLRSSRSRTFDVSSTNVTHTFFLATNGITVEKAQEGSVSRDIFRFKMTLVSSDGTPLTGSWPVYSWEAGREYSSREGSIELDASGSAEFSYEGSWRTRISWLPDGVTYHVEELPTDGYSTYVVGAADGVTDVLTDRNKYVRFVNVAAATVNVDLLYQVTFDQKLEGNDFTFELLNEKGEVIAQATNDAEGQIVFTAPFNSTQTHDSVVYSVRQVQGDDPYVVYDDSVKYLTADLSWASSWTVADGPIPLIAEVEYVEEDTLFINYSLPKPPEPEPESEPTPESEPEIHAKPYPKSTVLPKTGDSRMSIWLATGMVGFLAMMTSVYCRFREDI